MKVRVQKWGYPTSVNQGLESNKKWYEFQLVEDNEIEMSADEITQLIADAAEHGHYLTEDVNGLPVLFTGETFGDKCYTLPKAYFEV